MRALLCHAADTHLLQEPRLPRVHQTRVQVDQAGQVVHVAHTRREHHLHRVYKEPTPKSLVILIWFTPASPQSRRTTRETPAWTGLLLLLGCSCLPMHTKQTTVVGSPERSEGTQRQTPWWARLLLTDGLAASLFGRGSKHNQSQFQLNRTVKKASGQTASPCFRRQRDVCLIQAWRDGRVWMFPHKQRRNATCSLAMGV